MSNTAPYVPPNDIRESTTVNIENIDIEQVNIFNQKISVCSSCEHCINQNGIPFCEEYTIPLSVAANKESCPIGKW